MVVRPKNRRWQELEKDTIPLEKLTRHFEAYNRSEGKSPKTIECYSNVLRYFAEYLKQNDLPDTLADLNIDVVRDFILYLQTKKRWSGHPYSKSDGYLSPGTVQNYVRTLRPFFSWLYREGYTEENILERLRPPRIPQKMVEVLTNGEVSNILNCIDNNTTSGSRDKAVVITFLDTGLRLSELIGLKFDDAHIDQGYLKVMGKGAKERVVPIGSVAEKALQRYLFHFRPEPFFEDQDNFFLTLDGKPMSINSVQTLFCRLAKKSGVKRFHAHLCRHTFATNYLINGGDVFSLQQILGHSSLEMVRRYVTLASAQVRVQHRKFSPMDKMNLGRVKLGRVGGNGGRNGSKSRKELLAL
ncbi:MAG TPA: tyrosine-type recombinase/integrase [Dehalococcoidia bacterium]|nr:tyrosine-type recombinase/integrase [Dehalococcoidia bacterium]